MRFLSATAVLLALAVAGCGSSSSTDTSASLGPPKLDAVPLDCNHAATADENDVYTARPVFVGDSTRLAISLTVTNITLRPPGGCIGITQCGHLHAVLDGDEANAVQSSALVLELPAEAGMHDVVVELRADDESVLLDAVGVPLRAHVSVALTDPMPCP